uniref:Uncharacterized protein n=1 Tax=Strigamia maritima TaxID=126957 RepID=T1J7E4_STRMM
MHHIRPLYLPTIAAITIYLPESLRNNKFFNVNAQPQQPDDINTECECGPLGPWDISNQNINLDLLNTPETSTPIKPTGSAFMRTPGPRLWAPYCNHKSQRHHYPNVCDLGNYFLRGIDDIKVCRNLCSGLPNWTLEMFDYARIGDDHSCRYCRYRAALMGKPLGGYPDPVDFENDPEFELKFGEYCNIDLDPCVFNTLPPEVHRDECQSSRLWDDLYHYVLFLIERYDTVFVCSGPYFVERDMTDEERKQQCPIAPKGTKILKFTHYFKAIFIQHEEEEKNYLWDSFMIPVDTVGLKNPELADYRISREKLEDLTKMKILMKDVENCERIKKEIDFKEFIPHRFCRMCFPDQEN